MKRKHADRDLDDPIQLRLFTDQTAQIRELHNIANKHFKGLTNLMVVDIHRLALDRGLEFLSKTDPSKWAMTEEERWPTNNKKPKESGVQLKKLS